MMHSPKRESMSGEEMGSRPKIPDAFAAANKMQLKLRRSATECISNRVNPVYSVAGDVLARLYGMNAIHLDCLRQVD